MEQISQLRTMREEAIARLQVNPDFKLVNSLDALIQDLEEFSRGMETAPIVAEAVPETVAENPIDNLEVSAPVEDDEDDIEANEDVFVEEQIASNEVEANSIAAEISNLADHSADNAEFAIESLEAELMAATTNDGAESGIIADGKIPDANGLIN